MTPNLLLVAGGGLLSGLFYLAILAGGMGSLIIAYLAPLPLLLLGLSLGAGACLAGGVVGTVLVAGFTGPMAALAFLLADAVPAALVVRQALLARPRTEGGLEWYPPGLLIMVVTGYGIALVAAAALVTLGRPDGLEGVVRDLVEGYFGAAAPRGPGASPGDGAVEAMDQLLKALVPVFPAIVVVSWLIMTVANAALAQGVLMRFGRNRRPPMRMSKLALPGWAPWAIAASGGLALLAPGTLGYVAANATVILLVPFFFAGLAIVHAFAEKRSRPMVLVLFYGFLLLFQWPIPLVVGMGFVDQWAGLRRRFAHSGPDSEDV